MRHCYRRAALDIRAQLAGRSLRQRRRTVTDERWQLAYTIYEAAAPLAEPTRREYIDAAAPDAEVAAKVFAMLEDMDFASESEGFPEDERPTGPVASGGAAALPEAAALGRFVITSFVGRGGM